MKQTNVRINTLTIFGVLIILRTMQLNPTEHVSWFGWIAMIIGILFLFAGEWIE